MQHKCKVTVIDKKCFNDYQEKYLADPKSGPCPFYNVGTSLFLNVTAATIPSGAPATAHSAAKRGIASAVIFTLRFRAAALCAAGLMTSA